MLTHVETTPIETERLFIRKFEISDRHDMLKYWISDPEVQSLYSEPVYTDEKEVIQLIEKYIEEHPEMPPFNEVHTYRFEAQ